MCTAISFQAKHHYFGRNLDLERTYGEAVTITPRSFPFRFRNGTSLPRHLAIIGMAAVVNDFPLYFDATNEAGLSMAGLNFPGNAQYAPFAEGKENFAPFELIPWLLGTCKTLDEAKQKLQTLNIWDTSFRENFPNSPLHWLIADKTASMVLEATAEGMKLYENAVGVLTNNPPFPFHLHNLANYMQLTHKPPVNNQPIQLAPYSLGMGSFGLPGDMSSASRFVRAAFLKLHSECDAAEGSEVSQFFHILAGVAQPRGATQLENGEFEFTQYSSCCNTDRGIYYYKTYENSTIHAVSLQNADLNGYMLSCFPLETATHILFQN